MRVIFLYILLCITINCISQIDKNLFGSWIKIEVESYDGKVFEKMGDESLSFLKYTFYNNGNLSISVHYTSDGIIQKYLIRNNLVELSFGKKFQIEKIDSDSLIIVELQDENITKKSIRNKFIREQKYLDLLALAPDDKVVIDNDTAYIESEKLYPRFRNKDFRDHNQFLNNCIENTLKKDIYAYATCVISPDGKINNINILHHVNKSFDNKIINAIKMTKGMWVLPMLNGKCVSIVKIIEIRITYSGGDRVDYSKLDDLGEYSMEYYENFNLVGRSMLNKDYIKALEYIAEGEDLRPNEPNFLFLKYLCYKEMGNNELSTENLNLLKETPLKYLVK
jgi:hypothetical protein